MHILIVDDEALARARLRTLLADCQAQQPQPRYTVAEAAHAAEA
ncbi:MAG: DNA-binding response regulator, partial [Paenacidovorax caeni]